MDFNKVSGHTILSATTAIAAVMIAVAVRYGCLAGGLDAGTANLVFVVVLAVEAVLYLLLVKSIARFVDNRLAKRNGKRVGNAIGSPIPAEESVHDRIVRERFEENIAVFCEYTAKVIGGHISADQLGRLDGYIKSFAEEQPLNKIEPMKVPSHKITNNDLYHYGWNLWNHFRSGRADKRQECAVEWLKAVFTNLENIEPATIKGKLTIHDPKGHISRQKSIPDFLRLLKE
jgi:hypothetical protein